MYDRIILNPIIFGSSSLRPGKRLGFKVIAIIGYDDDWAAYRGLTHWTDEEVTASGDKITREAAEALFCAPVAAGLKYRR